MQIYKKSLTRQSHMSEFIVGQEIAEMDMADAGILLQWAYYVLHSDHILRVIISYGLKITELPSDCLRTGQLIA